jgi:hypothetical protein
MFNYICISLLVMCIHKFIAGKENIGIKVQSGKIVKFKKYPVSSMVDRGYWVCYKVVLEKVWSQNFILAIIGARLSQN